MSAPITAAQTTAATPPSQVSGYQATASPVTSSTSAAPEDLETLWAQLVDGVARVSKFAANYLINAHPVSFTKGVFVIGYDAEFSDQMGLADNSKNHAILQTKLAELGHPNSQFKFIVAETPIGRAPLAPPTPAPVVAPTTPNATPAAVARSAAPPSEKKTSMAFNKDDFKNDPLIQKALEVFKGQIVEVRA